MILTDLSGRWMCDRREVGPAYWFEQRIDKSPSRSDKSAMSDDVSEKCDGTMAVQALEDQPRIRAH
jgi:hypothetical protein